MKITAPKSEIEILNEVVEALRVGAVQPGLAGYKPQPYQQEFHNCPKRGRLFMGGNRVGKTVSATADACMILCGEHPIWTPIFGKRFIRGRAIGVDFDNGVELILIPEYKRWIPKRFLIDGSWDKSYNKSLRMLTLTNGSTIEFRSYDQDINKFAGTSRHFVHFDEEPPEGIFDENMARLVDTNGIWFISMTPLIDQSWTEDRLYTPGVTGENPHIGVFEVATSENKYVKSESMEVLYFGMSKAAKEARLAGEYQTYKRAVYKDLLTESHFIDPVVDANGRLFDEYLDQTKWLHFTGLDHGLSNPTCHLWGMVNKDEEIIIYKEYYVANKLIKEHAEAIHKITAQLGCKPAYGVIDPATRNRNAETGNSVQSVYAELGLSFSLGTNDITLGLDRVSSRLKLNKLRITRDCVKVKWEFNRYRWAKFVSPKSQQTNNNKEKPIPKDDHAMDALRYMLVSRPALPTEVDIVPRNPLNLPISQPADIFNDPDFVRVSENVELHDDVLGSNF